MKTLTKTLLCVIGLTLVPLALFAAQNQAAIPEHQLDRYILQDLTLPVPEKVVAPPVNRQFVGCRVHMKLTVGTDGRASRISQKRISRDPLTNDLAAAMKAVLRQWRFEPALNEAGNPVAVEIIIPVEVVKAKRDVQEFASIALAEPILLARVN